MPVSPKLTVYDGDKNYTFIVNNDVTLLTLNTICILRIAEDKSFTVYTNDAISSKGTVRRIDNRIRQRTDGYYATARIMAMSENQIALYVPSVTSHYRVTLGESGWGELTYISPSEW